MADVLLLYIVNLSLQSAKTDLHTAHKRQDKSTRLFHISDHDLVATFTNQMDTSLLNKFLQIQLQPPPPFS